MKTYNTISISFIVASCFIFTTAGFSESHTNSVQQDKIVNESNIHKKKRIEKPRIIIDIQEEILGIKDERSASNWVKERSADYGIRIVEAERAGAIAAKRADILGRASEASLRKEGILSNYDYVIQGKVSGNQEKEKGLYGSKGGIRFSLGMDMSVIEAATGDLIATIVIPPQDILVRAVASEQSAAREAVNRLMKGHEESIGADELFRKMESHWASEKDSGELYRMEFVGLDLEKADSLIDALSAMPGINEPRVCSVDAVGVSVLECQTQLKSLGLAALVQKTITGFKLDRSDAHYLSFRENGEDIKVLNAPSNSDAIDSQKDNWFEKYWQGILVLFLTPSPLAVRRIRSGCFGLIMKIIKKDKRHEDA